MSSRRSWLGFIAVFVSLLAGIGPSAPAAPVLAAAPLVVDDFEAGLPAGRDANNVAVGFNTFQDPNSSVAIATTAAPPAPVPGANDPNNVLKLDLDVVSYAGFTHSFENSAVNQWVSQDWSAYEGLSFWLYGNNSGTTLFVDVLDNRNPGATTDDAERWSVDFVDNFSGWKEIALPFASLHRKEIGNGAPNDGFGLTEVHGWALGSITTSSPQTYYVDKAMLYGDAPERPLTVGWSAINYSVTEGHSATVTARLSKPTSEPVTVQYRTTIGPAIANRDYTPAAGTLTFPPNSTQQSFTIATIDDAKYQGARGVQVELFNPTGGAALGLPPVARVSILDNEVYDRFLLDDFEGFPYLWSADHKATLSNPEIASGSPTALPGQGAYERVLRAEQKNGDGAYQFDRSFAIGQDWSDSAGLNFWYYGKSSGKEIGVWLLNNQAGVGSPSQWKLAWSDEFNGKPGAAPDSSVWGREIGDGVAIGNPGWGNDELEYYTDSTDNAATDGQGNLVITAKAADGSLQCYYGPCRYTSARLLTKNRFEIAYGRVEARIKVPRGAGLWPAFWMLGTDIDQVNWPQTGEIDIMENVGRLPNQVFGTLHGPGYSGGQSYGGIYNLGKPVADDFHIFAIDWQPNKIVWYIDGIQYHQATPNDGFLQGKQWVYNHPFFMLLNVAVGGNFGGAVGADTTFPQSMLVDYVRLYQAKPRPVTFNATFRDVSAGWQKVTIPFSSFKSDEGLTLDLTKVQGIGFNVPDGLHAPVLTDQLRLTCASEMTVTSAADSGAGSLRRALGSVCVNGTIRFAPSLADQTITNLSTLAIGKSVTIDGADAPGLAISGGGVKRVFEVFASVTATIRNLTLTNGYGSQRAGGVLNNGTLTLDHVAVTGNTMATTAGDFWQGGGGIYNDDGATLNLVDSTVSNNTAGWSGGGVYSFFNTTTTIVRSTISGNTSADVGGGIRSLGNMTITNSTISGNTSTGWHGGAIFHTDGAMEINSSTIANNIGPDWAPSAVFIGSFNAAGPSLKLSNTLITGNQWYACEWHAAGTVSLTSGGHNLVQDDSCNPVASDKLIAAAQIGALASNGGPTLTHALLAGSPAIDAADASTSPATDQRGIARPA
ncbi:MAG TPA: family 16 glycosylhydrolase, partial [Roseiflexaceae bacterium]|nr:family 16 glycosylhydrolase [Roseiflexaceae bacterium]